MAMPPKWNGNAIVEAYTKRFFLKAQEVARSEGGKAGRHGHQRKSKKKHALERKHRGTVIGGGITEARGEALEGKHDAFMKGRRPPLDAQGHSHELVMVSLRERECVS